MGIQAVHTYAFDFEIDTSSTLLEFERLIKLSRNWYITGILIQAIIY